MTSLKRQLAFTIITALLLAGGTFCRAQNPVTLAPENPAFTAYRTEKARIFAAGTLDGKDRAAAMFGLGYAPAPANRLADMGRDITALLPRNVKTKLSAYITPSEELSFSVTDSSYDLRNLSKLTPVRNQGAYGTCWAFGTLAAAESNLLPGETWNFSENNMAMNSGFYTAATDLMNYGGTSLMAAAYLLRWGGPANETDDPYDGVARAGIAVRKHQQQAFWLPIKGTTSYNSAFVTNMKTALTNYGPAAVSFFWDDAAARTNFTYFYNSQCTFSTYTTCTPQSSYTGWHMVAIVGWNDNVNAANFTSAINGTPAGNGAWIARNSWGTSVGESGYFYISYYDKSLGDEAAVFPTAESASNYSRVYGYDRLGWVSSLGSSSVTGWLAMQANSAAAGEELKAVGFYSTEANATYTVYVYTGSANGAPRTGTLAATASGTLGLSGYHTVTLPAPVTLPNQGTRFSVVVRLTNPSSDKPVAVQKYQFDYADRASASANQTFYSADGNTWTDMTLVTTAGAACVKTYSSGGITSGDVDTSTIVVKGYPSPCDFSKTPVMTLGGMLTEQRNVKIRVYSLSGQLVRSFTDGNGLAAGNQAFWDGKNENGEKVASGVYIVVFSADGMDPKTEKVAVLW